ncbi:MAG: hypothetical protein QM529_05800 [Hydrotalea sp.]|nr:hypothetical protein [Hydrotalea sp.]
MIAIRPSKSSNYTAGLKYGDCLILVKNNNTKRRVLDSLINSERVQIRRNIAKHPNANKKILNKLKNDTDNHVLFNIVTNPNSSNKINKHIFQKKYFISYSFTTEKIYLLISCQREPILSSIIFKRPKDKWIECEVAKNKHTSRKTLNALLNYKGKYNDWIKSSLAKNPKIPTSFIDTLIKYNGKGKDFVKYSLIENPRINKRHIIALLNSGDKNIIRKIRKNPSTPFSILKKIIDKRY